MLVCWCAFVVGVRVVCLCVYALCAYVCMFYVCARVRARVCICLCVRDFVCACV